MLELKNVSFTYHQDNMEEPLIPQGINNINLTIKSGEFLVLTGSSGCGKTTVTRLLNGLIPHYYKGNLSGEILLDGKDVTSMPIYKTAKTVGSVFQNPRSQFFQVDSTSELTFACENQGIPVDEIEQRLHRVMEEYQIQPLIGRSLFKLSGGEKQKIACACVSVAESQIIVLDEPSSNLDQDAIWQLKEILSKWKHQGKTIIIAEHRLHFLKELADRLVVMKDGKIIREYIGQQIENITKNETEKLGLRPMNLEEIHWIQKNSFNQGKILTIPNMSFAYSDKQHGISLQNIRVKQGSVVAIIGHNGAGKSTFANCLCGLEKKCVGHIILDSKVIDRKKRLQNCYMVMQDVNHQLFTESVLSEVELSLKEMAKGDEEQYEEKAKTILEENDLLSYADTHPMALSGGQKQRVAIASAVASKRPIIVFDEPTSGLDYFHMKQTSENIKKLQLMGKTIFVITHDFEFIMECCTDVLHLEQGYVQEQYEITEESFTRLKEFFQYVS